jgi:hypothetical protein
MLDDDWVSVCHVSYNDASLKADSVSVWGHNMLSMIHDLVFGLRASYSQSGWLYVCPHAWRFDNWDS